MTSPALIVACLLVAGCATERLNSERIAERYGSYAVTVVRQDARWRIASLESREGDRRVTRTLALVRFAAEKPPVLADVDLAIRNGASIGSSFRDAGWVIDKPLIHLGEIDVGDGAAAVSCLMNLELPARLAVHIYRFDVQRGGTRYRYASIVELHHPDYLGLAALESLYGAANADAAAAARLLSELEQVLMSLSVDLAERSACA